MPVIEALKYSTSLPLFLTPMKKDQTLLIDGGVIDNYPISILYHFLPKEEVIGCKFVSSDDVQRERPIPTNIYQYVMGIVDILERQALRYHVHKEDWTRTIQIQVGAMGATNLDLTSDEQEALIEAGVQGATQFLDGPRPPIPEKEESDIELETCTTWEDFYRIEHNLKMKLSQVRLRLSSRKE